MLLFYTLSPFMASGKRIFSGFLFAIDKTGESGKMKEERNMKMKQNRLLLMVLTGVLLVGCGRYNVNFPPPSDFAGITDLFPERIDGEPMMATVSGFDQGLAYAYKGIGSIWVYRADTRESAAYYFDNSILPVFEGVSSVRSWNINGERQVCARSSEGYSVGWTNGKWLFLIRGSNKTGLKKIIKVYPWIED